VSTEYPPPSQSRPDLPAGGGLDDVLGWGLPLPRPRRKFQHNYPRHLLFFLLTFLTTSFVPAWNYFWAAMMAGQNPFRPFIWPVFVYGLWYSVPVLIILGAHEFGHYFLCRFHNVDATLPYFIPAPLPPTGTLGAVIRIREPFPSKRALFDIGIAGPIGGFIALLPFLYIGLAMSQVARIPPGTDVTIFGDPLLLKGLAWLRFGPIPKGSDVVVHPMAFAAWWGMLATALNLLPFGQLDGGHISYALFGRRASYVSIATLCATILLTLHSISWVMTTIMMLVMAFFLGVGHPRIIDEETPLGGSRRLIALFALIMFVLCFTPVPIQTFLTK
jgi:membrane-associated protease RseP (regulator of RpoE activity)